MVILLYFVDSKGEIMYNISNTKLVECFDMFWIISNGTIFCLVGVISNGTLYIVKQKEVKK